MQLADIEYEIHFLIKLPKLIATWRKEISQLYDNIGPTVQCVDDLGELRQYGSPIESLAIEIADNRASLERRISKATNRGKRIVGAINSLSEVDRERLIHYYLNGRKGEVRDVFDKLKVSLHKRLNRRTSETEILVS